MALNSNKAIVRLILVGTLIIAALLLGLLLLHDVFSGGGIRYRSYVVVGCIIYLAIAYGIYRRRHISASGWMLMAFYFTVMSIMLLFWGLNAPIGILSVAFVIFLPGILFGPRAIISVSLGIAAVLAIIQIVHDTNIITPKIDEINTRTTTWDAIAYIIIFAVFGLLSWLSSTQVRKTLKRARVAEKSIREQRNIIRAELEDEYARARQNRLIEIERLYKFATLGQSTAATLHELSNQLSVLNMDIDDFTQQHKNSKVITRAKESIDHINYTLRHIRRRLTATQDSDESFSVLEATQTAIRDVRKKFQQRHVTLETEISPQLASITLRGDPLSWSHIITILVTNALEACQDLVHPQVLLRASTTKDSLILEVFDNGVGILPIHQNKLFQPVASTKPNGMGIGLYVTKHIIDSQFNGTINYTYIGSGATSKAVTETEIKNTHTSIFKSGSKFTITIPLTNTPRLEPEKGRSLS